MDSLCQGGVVGAKQTMGDMDNILKAAVCEIPTGVKQLFPGSHERFQCCPWDPQTVFQEWFSCPEEVVLR